MSDEDLLKTAQERFWSHVHKTDGCWLWTGSTCGFRRGYGSFRVKNRKFRAHRASWALAHGPISSGLFVCHRCDVSLCVNPEHLFLGTHSDNMKDMTTKGRRYVPTGEHHPSHKLSESDVRSIREMAKRGLTRTEIAPKFGVSRQLVSGILAGKWWSHVE